MIIDAKTTFGFLMDGSDETAKFNAAIAATAGLGTGNTLYFDGGVIGLNGPNQIGSSVTIDGAGENKVIFKNLSTNKRMFDFDGPSNPLPAPPYTGPDFKAAFSTIRNISIDQNGCSKSAIRFNTMYCSLENVWVFNQGGGSTGEYAINVNNGTHFGMTNVGVTNSDNCLNIENSFYADLRNVSLERQKGRALRVDACIQFNASSLYLDHGNPGAAGNNVPEMAVFRGVSGLLINGMSTEIAPGAGTLINNVANTGDDPRRAYIIFDSIESGEVNSLGVSHSAGGGSAIMAAVISSTIAFRGTKWTEANSPNMILFYIHRNNMAFSADNTTTRLAHPSGSVYGVGAWGGQSGAITLRGWKDITKASTASITALNILCEQISCPIDVWAAGPKMSFTNCGTLTGSLGGAHRVNC
jgi:hypothetical protein